MNRRRVVLLVAYSVSLAVVAGLAFRGSSYYLTPLQERPRHPDYWALKPGGEEGHLFGIVGSTLMVLMLVYSLHKRVPALRRFGTARLWLDFHIYCGVFGPLLVILHSSFKVTGLVALSFWSMILVAASGVLGRYLYLQLPRRRSGAELTLREAEELSSDLAERLKERHGLSDHARKRLGQLAAGGLRPDAPLALLLLRMPWEGLLLRLRLRRFVRDSRVEAKMGLLELSRLARQQAFLQRRILLSTRLQQLFHYWHVFHKPFAIVMYLFMVVHIAVAVATGYAWGAGH